jgi:hypothetical protein
LTTLKSLGISEALVYWDFDSFLPSGLQNKVVDFFLVSKEFLIPLEVSEYPQEDYSHVLVHAINYVQPFFLSPENHVAAQVLFKFVQFIEFHVGAIKNVSHNRPFLLWILQIFKKCLVTTTPFMWGLTAMK